MTCASASTNGWNGTPSPSSQRPSSTKPPSRSTARPSSAASRVLPTPGSPATRTARRVPVAASFHASSYLLELVVAAGEGKARRDRERARQRKLDRAHRERRPLDFARGERFGEPLQLELADRPERDLGAAAEQARVRHRRRAPAPTMRPSTGATPRSREYRTSRCPRRSLRRPRCRRGARGGVGACGRARRSSVASRTRRARRRRCSRTTPSTRRPSSSLRCRGTPMTSARRASNTSWRSASAAASPRLDASAVDSTRSQNSSVIVAVRAIETPAPRATAHDSPGQPAVCHPEPPAMTKR